MGYWITHLATFFVIFDLGSPIVQSDSATHEHHKSVFGSSGMENLSCLGWDHMCIDKSSNHSVKHQIHNLTNLGREITI